MAAKPEVVTNAASRLGSARASEVFISPGEDLFGAVNIGPSAALDVSETKEFGSTADETSHGKMNSPSPSSSFGIQHLEIVFTSDTFEFGSCT